ncbi:AI-2E family transporter [Actinomycetospora chiangmaiensis]|uniref:AI-2E family transporter n=1 Tax=Actinomycetospora chiangmaiensis TaxID=402650 RepID=UPI00037D7F9E|nr:AI-2E family transporter [Actinomycetospora chiangmaiensis]
MTEGDGPTPVSAATADPPPSAALPRGVVILLGAAAAVVVVVGMSATSWLLGPLLLALIIVIAVSPIQTWLRRRGWPSWAATASLVVVIYGTLVVLAGFLVASVSQLSALLAQSAGRAQQLVASLGAALARVGVDPAQARDTAGSADLSKVAGTLGSLLSGLGSILSSLVFLLALLLFLTAESSGTARRMAMIATQRPHMVSALEGFVSGTRNYLVVTAVFGFIVAVLDGAALALMGIPLVVLWAVLSFITNFIPNIGFIIGLVPPALLALITGGWQLALAVVVVYCVLNMVIQSLIQPRFIGDSVGLSTTVTFLALLFWAWVLGPLGALLAIPVTLLVKAILVDSDPRALWVEALLGSTPAPEKAKKPKKPRKSRRHVGNGHVPVTEDGLTPPRV